MFPFTYQGENFETCTKKNAESFWCGTKVDSDGNQIYGQWDYCSGDCSEFLSIKDHFCSFVFFSVSHRRHLLRNRRGVDLHISLQLRGGGKKAL